jgi:hypothetical protein
MDYIKIMNIVDNLSGTFSGIDSARLEILKHYILEFQNELNDKYAKRKVNAKTLYITSMEYKNVFNISDNSGNNTFRNCFKIGHPNYLKFPLNEKSLTDMITLFEDKKQDIEKEVIQLIDIMHYNLHHIIEKMKNLQEDLKLMNPCECKDINWEFLYYTVEYISSTASVRFKVYSPKFDKVRIEIPLYKTYTDEDYKKLLSDITTYTIDSVSRSILGRYNKEFKQYEKDLYTISYGWGGQQIKTLNTSVKKPKLSLEEKYILVEYAIGQNDIVLINRMYNLRSHFPKHLKYRLAAALVMQKLVNT